MRILGTGRSETRVLQIQISLGLSPAVQAVELHWISCSGDFSILQELHFYINNW